MVLIKKQTMNLKMKTSVLMVCCLLLLGITSCKKDDDKTPEQSSATPSEILASVTWKSTTVKDQTGKDVTAANGGYVGLAKYNLNGDFEIRAFDGTLRSSGQWALTADGKKRMLIGTTAAGAQFSRVVDILVLSKEVFTYRITNPQGEVVDVEHVPN